MKGGKWTAETFPSHWSYEVDCFTERIYVECELNSEGKPEIKYTTESNDKWKTFKELSEAIQYIEGLNYEF